MDWAPEWVIESTLDSLKNIPLVLHLTNKSAYIEKQLNKGADWEIGIHPNFECDSTHGKTTSEVFDNLLEIVPQPRIWRSHSLLTSTRIKQHASKIESLKFSSNIYDPNLQITPFYSRYGDSTHLEIPINFEDDLILAETGGLQNVKSKIKKFDKNRLYVFNLHPTHLYFNSNSLVKYLEFKNQLYAEVSFNNALTKREFGITDLLEEILTTNMDFVKLDFFESSIE